MSSQSNYGLQLRCYHNLLWAHAQSLQTSKHFLRHHQARPLASCHRALMTDWSFAPVSSDALGQRLKGLPVVMPKKWLLCFNVTKVRLKVCRNTHTLQMLMPNWGGQAICRMRTWSCKPTMILTSEAGGIIGVCKLQNLICKLIVSLNFACIWEGVHVSVHFKSNCARYVHVCTCAHMHAGWVITFAPPAASCWGVAKWLPPCCMCLHTCTCMHSCICMPTCVLMGVQAHPCTHVHALCMGACTHAHGHVHMCTCICVCTCPHAHMCVHGHVCTHMRAHVSTHAHVRVNNRAVPLFALWEQQVALTCANGHMHIIALTCTLTCAHMHMHSHMHVHVHMHSASLSMCTCTCMCGCMHICVHVSMSIIVLLGFLHCIFNN